uniref:Leucine rich repeat containing 36 n=1 Tax=Homo sapiens TaxID=9606 RepID=H3BS33_HUMAN
MLRPRFLPPDDRTVREALGRRQ